MPFNAERERRVRGIVRGRSGGAGLGTARTCWDAIESRHEMTSEWGIICMVGRRDGREWVLDLGDKRERRKLKGGRGAAHSAVAKYVMLR